MLKVIVPCATTTEFKLARWEDDRCLYVALLYDIRYKGQLNLSIRKQPLLPVLDVFGMG